MTINSLDWCTTNNQPKKKRKPNCWNFECRFHSILIDVRLGYVMSSTFSTKLHTHAVWRLWSHFPQFGACIAIVVVVAFVVAFSTALRYMYTYIRQIYEFKIVKNSTEQSMFVNKIVNIWRSQEARTAAKNEKNKHRRDEKQICNFFFRVEYSE